MGIARPAHFQADAKAPQLITLVEAAFGNLQECLVENICFLKRCQVASDDDVIRRHPLQ